MSMIRALFARLFRRPAAPAPTPAPLTWTVWWRNAQTSHAPLPTERAAFLAALHLAQQYPLETVEMRRSDGARTTLRFQPASARA